MRAIRSLAFYIVYVVATVIWGGFWTLFGLLLPYRARFVVIINWWSRFVLLWLRITCGIHCKIEGLEHIPDQPCVVLARHESTWETIFLQSLFVPQTTVVKRSLLHIPFFGWPLRLLRPIAVDRNKPREALLTLGKEGARRLQQGIWVVLFPEGTRCPVGEIGRFGPGGAYLCQTTGAPCLVIGHNSGRHWPPHQLTKYPGEIRLKITPLIDTSGKTAKEINALARQRLLETCADP